MFSRISQFVNYLIAKYEWLLRQLLKINVVQVRRERIVRKVVHRFFRDNEEEMYEKAMSTSLASILTEEQQDKCHRSIIRRFGIMVFVMSFFTSFPESMWGIVLACALDLAFFQACLYIAMQQIMQIYGMDVNLKENKSESVEAIASIESSGLMLGKYPLLQKMKSVMGWLGKQLVKRLGPKYVAKASRAMFIVIRRQAIKWFSIIIAKQDIELVFNMIIPVTCAIISGVVSVIIFIPMCNKLKRHLQEQASKDEATAPVAETAEAQK